MRRRTVAMLMLGGIWLAGGVGGRLMSQGGRPRPRSATAGHILVAAPLAVVSEACRARSAHPEVGCDAAVVASGD